MIKQFIAQNCPRLGKIYNFNCEFIGPWAPFGGYLEEIEDSPTEYMVRWLFRVTRNDDSAWPSNDEQFTIDVSEGVYLGDVIQCTGTLQSASEIDFGDKIVSTIGEDSNAKYLLAVPYSNGTYLSVEEILYDDADIQITDMRSSLSTNKCIITKTNTGTLRNYVALLPGFANDYKGSLLYEGNIAININIDAIYNESSETIPFNGQRNYILTIPGAGSHITGMSGGEWQIMYQDLTGSGYSGDIYYSYWSNSQPRSYGNQQMIITDSGIVRNTTHCFTFIVCNCTSLDIKNAQVSFLGLYAPTQQSISESTNFLFRVESASKNRPLANATMQISSDINTGDLSPTFTFSGTLKRPEDISGQTNYFPEEPNVNVAYLIAPATTSGVGIEHIIGYYLSTYAADVSNTTININTQENSDYTIKLSTANTFTQSKYSGVIIKHNWQSFSGVSNNNNFDTTITINGTNALINNTTIHSEKVFLQLGTSGGTYISTALAQMQGVPATVVCEVNLKTTTAYNFNFNGIYNKAYFDSAGSALPSYNSQSDLAVIHRTINYTLNNNTAIFNRGQLIISIDAA